jgi:1,2-diacylglycerol 3-alpha-glucosyltransferase
MKVAIFSDTYIPDINGVATSTRILRNQLVKRGHEVIVVTSELPSDSDYVDDPHELILRVPGLEIQRLYGYRACNIYSFKGMRELKNHNIDVIHVQTDFGIGIFSRLAAEVLNVPLVYTYHTMWTDYSHYLVPMKSNAVEGLIKKVISRISKIYGNNCTELIVPSIKTKEALEQYGLDKRMHVIPTGLELENFDPINRKCEVIENIKQMYQINNRFVITFLGRIAEEKSIDVIIKAVFELVKKRTNILCLIVGGGPSLDNLKKLVETYNLENYVIFTGPKSQDAVPSYYHISDIFVSASITETQGLTFIEAMASGVPVIARRDKNLLEVVNDGYNGFFFDRPEELAPLLERVMDLDLKPYGKQAYKDAMQYSSEVFCQKVEDVYELSINKKHYTYRVKSIYPIKNGRNEVVFLFDESEIIVEINDTIIENYKIEIGKVIDREIFDVLKDYEQISHAYQKALKYLTVKDYTKSQMEKKLMDSGNYDDTQLKATIDMLESKNLINDEAYTLQYIKRSARLGIGFNKAIYNLRNQGVDSTTIDECLEEIQYDEEYNAAIDVINTLYKKNTSSSHKAIIKRIRDRLYAKGFTNETIERAMSDYDFTYSEKKEEEVLINEYEKQMSRYKRKLSGSTLDEKVIDVLLRKGYNYDSIKQIINKQRGDI